MGTQGVQQGGTRAFLPPEEAADFCFHQEEVKDQPHREISIKLSRLK
jgi:hypothetical protein